MPLLDSAGPALVLGSKVGGFDLALPVVPSASTLFGPRGAALAGPDGPLFVADTGHHRLMIWHHLPTQDHAPADALIGQADFSREGRNGKGEPSASTLNVPTGVAASGDVLAVADAWNHRVLIWHSLPSAINQPADVVLGQADFVSVSANRGGGAPRADTLNWCYGVAILGSRLVVCDTGNRRVLIWNEIPRHNGTPADLVLGQTVMTCRDENGGHSIDLYGMRWPHSAALCGDTLFISDAGNNRVMAWTRMPVENGAPCDYLLGQTDPTACEHNRANYWPDAVSVNMPYACTAFADGIAVADTASSRLLGFSQADFAMGAMAKRLAGQPDFHAKGDNRWQEPVRDSLCWPYGLTSCGDTLVIADSGNNRVLLWRRAP
jgi:hypothetical protein